MSEDRDKLKILLMSEEIAQIQAIRKLLDDQQEFSQKISEVLDQATDITIRNNPKFQKKFAKIDSKAYVRAIKANKQSFIDALLPIIGPMIRQSVTTAIRRFVSDVNRAMEMGFSLKALKWRWQSLRTGVPFAELVFNNTIAYQVQQIFLIDNETGLLIEYAGQESDLLQDKEAMSAMLTVIQDFIKDSIDNQSGGLSAAEIGDKLVWVIQGNLANLAVVVKGAPTSRLRDQLTDACGELHSDFKTELINQEKWNNNPELNLQLEQLLLTKSQSDDQQESKGVRWWPWVLLLLILVGWFSWSYYKTNQTYNQYHTELSQVPGFIMQQLTEQDGHFTAKGFADPHAEFKAIVSPDLTIETTPFISLHDDMIAARVTEFLAEPALSVSVNQGEVNLSGQQPASAGLSTKVGLLELVTGVTAVNDQTYVKLSIEEKLNQFLKTNPPPEGIIVELTNEQINLSGLQLKSVGLPYLTEISTAFNTMNRSSLQLFTPLELQTQLAENPLLMPQTQSIDSLKLQKLTQVYNQFRLILTANGNAQLQITGKSDCQGSVEESNLYASNRAQTVKQELLELGLPDNAMISTSDICKQVSDELDLSKLGVWFEVIE